MHRPTVGLIALALLGAAGAAFLLTPPGHSAEGWAAACLRVGLVMGALWLALPQLRRWPSWLGKVLLMGALLLFALKGRALVLAAIAYVVVLALRPAARPANLKESDAGGAQADK